MRVVALDALNVAGAVQCTPLCAFEESEVVVGLSMTTNGRKRSTHVLKNTLKPIISEFDVTRIFKTSIATLNHRAHDSPCDAHFRAEITVQTSDDVNELKVRFPGLQFCIRNLQSRRNKLCAPISLTSHSGPASFVRAQFTFDDQVLEASIEDFRGRHIAATRVFAASASLQKSEGVALCAASFALTVQSSSGVAGSDLPDLRDISSWIWATSSIAPHDMYRCSVPCNVNWAPVPSTHPISTGKGVSDDSAIDSSTIFVGSSSLWAFAESGRYLFRGSMVVDRVVWSKRSAAVCDGGYNGSLALSMLCPISSSQAHQGALLASDGNDLYSLYYELQNDSFTDHSRNVACFHHAGSFADAGILSRVTCLAPAEREEGFDVIWATDSKGQLFKCAFDSTHRLSECAVAGRRAADEVAPEIIRVHASGSDVWVLDKSNCVWKFDQKSLANPWSKHRCAGPSIGADAKVLFTNDLQGNLILSVHNSSSATKLSLTFPSFRYDAPAFSFLASASAQFAHAPDKDHLSPTIHGVMVTGKGLGRRALATWAIASFAKQTYSKKKLIIINDGEYSVLSPETSNPPYGTRFLRLDGGDNRAWINATARHHRLQIDGVARSLDAVEVFVDRTNVTLLGDLRNVAFDFMPVNALWVQWDDDDFSHPRRLEVQWNHMKRRGVHVSVLRRQLVYNTITGQHSIHECLPEGRRYSWLGHEGTIMARAFTTARYAPKRVGEDTSFLVMLQDSAGIHVSIVENDPSLFIKVKKVFFSFIFPTCLLTFPFSPSFCTTRVHSMLPITSRFTFRAHRRKPSAIPTL